ncbi:MAG: tetratricopeptide repeat protein, partial [Hyphomicrobiales bacterium]|nr:tetratricopeptide repeat protein [Hyphomicrobiales bacterium]
ILNAAKTDGSEAASLGGHWHYRIVTGVAAVVILGSVGIYGVVGHTDRYFAQQAHNAAGLSANTQVAQQSANPQAQQIEQVQTMVKRLEERVKSNPEDADGWRLLGWSYYNLEAFDDSVNAYHRALKLQEDNTGVRALLGEAMVKQAGGRVTEEALAEFEKVRAATPNDERALFFRGMAEEQKGNPQGAIDEWMALYKTAPKDAEWASDLRDRIESVAQASNINVSARFAKLEETKTASAEPVQTAQADTEQRGPTAEDVENAQQMAPEDQDAMVRGMVDGLAARLESSPNDPKGWIMLMRSYLVLKETDKAQDAYERASQALADSPDTLKQVSDAAESMGLSVSAE